MAKEFLFYNGEDNTWFDTLEAAEEAMEAQKQEDIENGEAGYLGDMFVAQVVKRSNGVESEE